MKEYESGTENVYNHFGNEFFGLVGYGDIKWYRMIYEEAEKLEGIVLASESDT